VWIGLYVGAAVVMLSDLLQAPTPLVAAAGATLLTMSVYQLDRIKWSNRLLDPADAEAHPERSAFLLHHATAVRSMSLVLAAASAALLGWRFWPLALLVPLSHGGMLLYAGGEHSKRIKDRLGLKNLAVAGAITALALTVVLAPMRGASSAGATGGDAQGWMPPATMTIAGAGFLTLIVLADAMLCDIEDASSDARYGTRTLPNTIGAGGTWAVAMALHVVAAAILIGERLVREGALDAATWSRPTALCASLALLALLRPKNLRDAVDMRLAVVVVILAA
jgi:4-hydroxybenzoate polyprenyltransferase